MEYYNSPQAPGYLYIMRAGDQWKIGSSTDPAARCRELRRKGYPETELVTKYKVSNMEQAEREAHKALTKKGLSQVEKEGRRTDWFQKPSYISYSDIEKIVEKAAKEYGDYTYICYILAVLALIIIFSLVYFLF